MSNIKCLQRGWRDALSQHIRRATNNILIASPYITQEGTVLIESNLQAEFRQCGSITIITDLSPLNIIQGSTDPAALTFLAEHFGNLIMWHLPKLHAKVYVVDSASAIVTSGNLTRGGIDLNYEYGVQIEEPNIVKEIRHDVGSYGELGARISVSDLARYRETAETVRAAFRQQQEGVTSGAKLEFERLFKQAEDELITLRVSGTAPTSIFEKTIHYLLDRYGPLTTPEIHAHMKAIHPDLCDETKYRVINGRQFGRKWKHAVRTAQSHLKKANRIVLIGNRWMQRRQVADN